MILQDLSLSYTILHDPLWPRGLHFQIQANCDVEGEEEGEEEEGEVK